MPRTAQVLESPRYTQCVVERNTVMCEKGSVEWHQKRRWQVGHGTRVAERHFAVRGVDVRTSGFSMEWHSRYQWQPDHGRCDGDRFGTVNAGGVRMAGHGIKRDVMVCMDVRYRDWQQAADCQFESEEAAQCAGLYQFDVLLQALPYNWKAPTLRARCRRHCRQCAIRKGERWNPHLPCSGMGETSNSIYALRHSGISTASMKAALPGPVRFAAEVKEALGR